MCRPAYDPEQICRYAMSDAQHRTPCRLDQILSTEITTQKKTGPAEQGFRFNFNATRSSVSTTVFEIVSAKMKNPSSLPKRGSSKSISRQLIQRLSHPVPTRGLCDRGSSARCRGGGQFRSYGSDTFESRGESYRPRHRPVSAGCHRL